MTEAAKKPSETATPVESKTPGPDAEKPKGTIRGSITYPWGKVSAAIVKLGEKSATSDTAGKYEFSALDPSVYTIVAKAPFPGYEASPQQVEIAAGETKDVDIYLDFEKTSVQGYVYDLAGKPIMGATLSGVLYGKDMMSVKTDGRGYFEFEKVTPGDRFVRVNAPGFMGETRDFNANKQGVTTVEFRLTPASCKIYGTVSDATGKPLVAEVLLLKAGVVVQKMNLSAEDGKFEFPVLPGRYELLPTATGYMSKGWYGDVGADTKVDFSLDATPAEPAQTGEMSGNSISMR
jgi:hypothetical protein